MEKTSRYRYETKKYDVSKIIKRLNGSSDGDTLLIPEYQRDFVWKEKVNIPSLLSSLYIGYPIGIISVWDNHKEDEHQLIDGLQRHYSIYKINEKPYNFLHYDMFKFWMKENEKEIKNDVDEKENFRHLKSKLNHKNTNYRRIEFEEVQDWIKTTSRLNSEERENYKEFINDYKKWFKSIFPKIIIPHIILSEFSVDEVAKIFELINSTGRKLNKFEIQSAQWSRYKIELNEEVGFISDFQSKKIRKYKSAFENPENISEDIIKYNNKKIIPSNFIYALFSESIKDVYELKYSFYDKNDNLQTKSIEAVSEIIKEALRKEFNLDDFSFEELGKKISENVKTREHVNSMVLIIKKSLKELLNSIRFLYYAKTNTSDKSVSYPSWLIAVFLIFIIRGSSSHERKEYKKWFIHEILFEKNYSSSTGNYAKAVLKENLYNRSLEEKKGLSDDNLINEIKEKVNSSLFIFDSISKITAKEKLLLSIISLNFYKPAIRYDIDHLIPQSILRNIKGINYNSIFNLQYLDSTKNKEKSNELVSDQLKWDVLKSKFDDKGKSSDYNNLMEYISKNIHDNNFDKEKLKDLIDLRKEMYIAELTKAEWLQ